MNVYFKIVSESQFANMVKDSHTFYRVIPNTLTTTLNISTSSTELYGQTIEIKKDGEVYTSTSFDNQGTANVVVNDAGTYTLTCIYQDIICSDEVVITNSDDGQTKNCWLNIHRFTWSAPLAYSNGGWYDYASDPTYVFPSGVIGQFMNESRNSDPGSFSDGAANLSKIAHKQIVYQDTHGIWRLADPYQSSGEIYVKKGSRIYLQMYCNTSEHNMTSAISWKISGSLKTTLRNKSAALLSNGLSWSSILRGTLVLEDDSYYGPNDAYSWRINIIQPNS